VIVAQRPRAASWARLGLDGPACNTGIRAGTCLYAHRLSFGWQATGVYLSAGGRPRPSPSGLGPSRCVVQCTGSFGPAIVWLPIRVICTGSKGA
jgi:hypothetical protein